MTSCLRVSWLSLAAIFFVLGVGTGYSQQLQELYDGNETLAPFGGFSTGQFDAVALQNGNLHISIPLVSDPERKGTNILSLEYNTPSFSWTHTSQHIDGDPTTEVDYVWQNGGGVSIPTLNDWELSSNLSEDNYCFDPSGVYLTDATAYTYNVIDPKGETHPFNLETSGACGDTATSPAYDGSGLMANLTTSTNGLYVQTYTIQLPDGTTIGNPTYQYNSNYARISSTRASTDPNGNITTEADT